MIIAQEVLITGIIAIIGASIAYGTLKATVNMNKENIRELRKDIDGLKDTIAIQKGDFKKYY